MDPTRVDSLTDLAYGVLILAAIVLMVAVGPSVGIAFGVGVFLACSVHVVRKTARYGPTVDDAGTRPASRAVGHRRGRRNRL